MADSIEISGKQFSQLLDELAGIREALEKTAEMLAMSLDGERGFRVNAQITGKPREW
jgi:hypothetical protein